MHTNLKASLLAGTAAAALLSLDPSAAQAQMYSSAPGVYLSLEGRYLTGQTGKFTDIGPLMATPALVAAAIKAQADKGWGGKGMLGYRFGNNWDVGFGFSDNWLKGHRNKSSSVDLIATMSTYNGRLPHTHATFDQSLKIKLDYQVADFEAGYNMTMGGASTLRVFGGLRVARFSQRANAAIDIHQTTTVGGPVLGTASTHYHGKRKTSFMGVGPRLGVNGQFAIAGGFNVFGGLSGALVYGRFKDRHSLVTTTAMGPTSSSFKDKRKSKIAPNAEGELGLGYTFNAGGSTIGLQVGYRADKWWGVSSDAEPLFPGQSSHASDVLTHGPFVRLVATFGSAPPMPAAPPPTSVVYPPLRAFIVFFDFDRSTITAQAQKTIDDAVTAIKTNAAKESGVTRITLVGHTDRSGSEQYNLALSIRRGEAVKAAMIRGGIPASVISVIGKGESVQLVPTADGVREPQNRRVEILI